VSAAEVYADWCKRHRVQRTPAPLEAALLMANLDRVQVKIDAAYKRLDTARAMDATTRRRAENAVDRLEDQEQQILLRLDEFPVAHLDAVRTLTEQRS
jgi:hypothetical protein